MGYEEIEKKEILIFIYPFQFPLTWTNLDTGITSTIQFSTWKILYGEPERNDFEYSHWVDLDSIGAISDL